MRIYPIFGIAVVLLFLNGCGESSLSRAEKWWLTPPATATMVAFEKDGKWGFRDRAGNVTVSPRFDYAASFPGEGNILVHGRKEAVHVRLPAKPMGRVMQGGKWGYVDGQGKVVIQPRFDGTMDFYEDLTAVKVSGKWGFIDTSGAMVLPPAYDEASPFLLGVAHVREGARWYTIDKTGANTAEK